MHCGILQNDTDTYKKETRELPTTRRIKCTTALFSAPRPAAAMADHFANGAAANEAANEPDAVLLPKITSALELIYNPQSSNADRQEAQKYLEVVKEAVQAPSVGFTLAVNTANPSVVRHFGLSMLEHSIKHKWAMFSADQTTWIRQWVLELAQIVSRSDPSFLRNKIGLLWVEVAKRCWASDWMDMDAQLLSLWQAAQGGDNVHKELVLYILETLSDEVFNGDDAVVALREGVLSKSCVDIFTPASVLNECFPNRTTTPNVRAGDEGWLLRVTELLSVCNSADVQSNDDARTCAVRALAVQTSLLPWAIPKAVIACQCVPTLCESLAAPHVAVQKAALEALHALYSRNHFTEEEFVALVIPMYDSKYVDLYYRLFEWSKVDVDDIDDDKYQFAKKFSEVSRRDQGHSVSRRSACAAALTNHRAPRCSHVLVIIWTAAFITCRPVSMCSGS